MSGDDSPILSRRTWARSIEPVSKIGYMDGAADGQAFVYQASFDLGYELGFDLGFSLASKIAADSMKQEDTTKLTNDVIDIQKINCQICLNGINNQEDIGNLYNFQRDKNLKILGINKD